MIIHFLSPMAQEDKGLIENRNDNDSHLEKQVLIYINLIISFNSKIKT